MQTKTNKVSVYRKVSVKPRLSLIQHKNLVVTDVNLGTEVEHP